MGTIGSRLRAGLMIAAAFGGATIAAAAQASAASAAPSEAAAVTGEARPVSGWSEFCARMPKECALDVAEPPAIVLSPRTRRLIASVNSRVNATVRSMTDEEHWGISDRWDLPADGFGDCEDYQLLKRRLLAEAGLPRRAMRMTVVVDETGDGHAVLMVHTDRGDVVLDNRTDAVLPWHRTGYAFVKRESQSSAAAWVSLGAAAAAAATAADPHSGVVTPPSIR